MALDAQLDKAVPPEVDQPRGVNRKRHMLPPRYSADFWDSLSQIVLSRGALRELDRRASYNQPAPMARKRQRLLRSDAARLRAFATAGGPDTSLLRGYCTRLLDQAGDISRSNASNFGQASNPATTYDRPSLTSTFGVEYEQGLIDSKVFPHEYGDSQTDAPEPSNLDAIRAELEVARKDLTAGETLKRDFRKFRELTARSTSESNIMEVTFPFVMGSGDSDETQTGDVLFADMERFNDHLIAATADKCYGILRENVDAAVCEELGRYILISSSDAKLPAVPNFFAGVKNRKGGSEVLYLQALHNGAIGARAIFMLQNFGKEEPIYDDNAYSITCTFHGGSGHLQMYVTHPVPPAKRDSRTQYYLTKVAGFDMTGDLETFRRGAAAYRNGRDWARRQRLRFVEEVNRVAQDRINGRRLRPAGGPADPPVTGGRRAGHQPTALAGPAGGLTHPPMTNGRSIGGGSGTGA